MKKILILNGPNLNLLGDRERKIYGDKTLEDIKNICIQKAESLDIKCDFYQSNIEGEIITNDSIDVLRPALGILPKYKDIIIGKKAGSNILKGEPIYWENI